MPYEQRDNSGSLFKNDKRETESHPNLKGSALIGGTEYWVSAWTKVPKTGDKWVSLSFTPKEARAATRPATTPALDAWDDPVPF
jgi:hypothetical protein